MSTLLEQAMRQALAARPASGFRPKNPDEWKKLLDAHENIGYAMHRTGGMPHHEDQHLAHLTHGERVGLLLLETAFGGDGNE